MKLNETAEKSRVELVKGVFGERLEKETKNKIQNLLTSIIPEQPEKIEITSVSQLYHLLVQFKGEILETLKGKKEEGDATMNNEDYIFGLPELLGGSDDEFYNLWEKYNEEKTGKRNRAEFERILKRFGYEKVKIYEYNENDKKEMEEDFINGKINLEELKLIISFLSSHDFGCLVNNLTYEISKFFLPILNNFFSK